MSAPPELDPVFFQPLRRPEARRRRRRPQPQGLAARPKVMWTALIIAVGGIGFAFAGQIATVAMHPLVATTRTGQEIRKMESQLKDELAANERLRDDIKYLKTSAGIEQEARRLGWTCPGEVALTLVQPETQPADTKPQPKPRTFETAAAEPSSVSGWFRTTVDSALAVLGPRPNIQ